MTPTHESVKRASSEMVAAWLADAHKRSLSVPIVGPNDAGAFPSTPGLHHLGLRSKLPPVVPDANLLRNDVRRTLRGLPRTVLVNAGNSGALRLLCPAHVAAEMYEHSEKFSEGFTLDSYLKVWERAYLPLMRIVDELPSSVLTPGENERIARLAVHDRDDVPSARLALATGAFFVSNDGHALDAVYGAGRDRTTHQRWVAGLESAGDAHELINALETGAFLANLVSSGVGYVGHRLSRSPALTAAAVAAAVAAFARAGSHRRRQLLSAADATMTVGATLFARMETARSELQLLGAPKPSPAQLRKMSSEGRLLRACLVAVSSSADSTHSAREIRQKLPALDVPSGESKVRITLRSHACFSQPYPGRFQLGRALHSSHGQ